MGEQFDKSSLSAKILEYGISWCESGKTESGEQTTICGECIYCDPAKCDAISDEVSN